MNGRLRLLLSLVLLLSVSGCIGTMVTRGQMGRAQAREGDFAGSYPFYALVYDCYLFRDDGELMPGEYRAYQALLAIFFWPLDLICDGVLLPADLALWPFGFDRRLHPDPAKLRECEELRARIRSRKEKMEASQHRVARIVSDLELWKARPESEERTRRLAELGRKEEDEKAELRSIVLNLEEDEKRLPRLEQEAGKR